jgi:hypothetical protein
VLVLGVRCEPERRQHGRVENTMRSSTTACA